MSLDDAMAEVVATSTQPALGAIRLAWWREALERLDGAPPPPEPRLEAVAVHLLPLGITGKRMGALETGWAALLEEVPDPSAVGEGGAILFSLASDILAAGGGRLEAAGRLFALVRAGRRPHGEPMIAAARIQLDELAGHSFAKPLRPLTSLARLAARDLKSWPVIEPPATPGRAVSLLSHRMFGIVA